jgi:hypothetical protein
MHVYRNSSKNAKISTLTIVDVIANYFSAGLGGFGPNFREVLPPKLSSLFTERRRVLLLVTVYSML